MSDTPNIWKTTLVDANDGTGDYFLELPDALLESLGWRIEDTLKVELLEDGDIKISRLT